MLSSETLMKLYRDTMQHEAGGKERGGKAMLLTLPKRLHPTGILHIL